MKPVRGLGPVCALFLLAVQAAPLQAAWNNVFQVCCNSCGGQPSQPSVSHYAPDPCNPCPQPVCTTRYVQRCYYQPVTTYQTRTYYEPVTTYRTSYYWEPVKSYRYSSYYDPCTCSYQQVACPQTCYRLRSQCCPVQSWAQRCCQVPVTSYRIASYWQPVTSCYTPNPCGPTTQGGTIAPPGVSTNPPPGPGISENRSPAMPGVSESTAPSGGSGSPLFDRVYPQQQPQTPPARMPNVQGSTYRQLPVPQPPARLPVKTTSPIRIDRIVSLPQAEAQIVLVNQPTR